MLLNSLQSKNDCVEERVTDSRTTIELLVQEEKKNTTSDVVKRKRNSTDNADNQDLKKKTEFEEENIQIDNSFDENNRKYEDEKKAEEECNYSHEFEKVMDHRGYWNERDLDFFIAGKKR